MILKNLTPILGVFCYTVRATGRLNLPILSNLRELDPAPRRFLVFTTFNVFSWQCIVGPTMILCARAIDMPASWVGVLVAGMPLSTLLVVGTVPLVNRLGPKRLMMVTWVWRNLAAATVFLLPWTIHHWGARAGWIVLMGATICFCLFRAIGVGGWFPWLHEILPPHQRGTFFSGETAIAQLATVFILAGQGLYLQGQPPLERFLVVYALGIGFGVFSVAWMGRVAGGHAASHIPGERSTGSSYAAALNDRVFIRFLLVAFLTYASVTWISSTMVLYLRDTAGLPAHANLLITAAGAAAVSLTVRHWGRYADHSGSGRAMAMALVGFSAAAALCIVLPPRGPWSAWGLAAAATAAATFTGAHNMAVHRAMLNYVRESGRVGYTSLWFVASALGLGLTPVLAGFIIEAWGLTGFRLCFALAALPGLLGAAASVWAIQDGPPVEKSLARLLLNPTWPVRTLARIAWITVGLHESNRPKTPPTANATPA